MSFHQTLEKYREISFSEQDKGARFERFMQAFLRTVSWYKDKFSRVWFWNEFPHQSSIGGKDTGIDLVAWNSYSILSEANKVVEWIQLIIRNCFSFFDAFPVHLDI